MSHCIVILKICHTLREKLVAMTTGSEAEKKTSATVSSIIVVAKWIIPRVDDVVKSVYHLLSTKLLDQRAEKRSNWISKRSSLNSKRQLDSVASERSLAKDC
nr:transmembrane protein 98-like [Pan troglodytes]